MLQPRLRPLAACKLLAGQQPMSRLLVGGFATAVESTSSASAAKSGAPTPFAKASTMLKGGAVMRTYKPRTPGLRHLRRPINDHLWKGRPFLPLTYPKKGMAKGGRNNQGKITVRHRGGGAKRRIRIVDFERWAPGPHLVERIEHDPGRSAHIALLTEEATGKKSYIVAAEGMRAGDIVHSYRSGLPQDLLDSMGGLIDQGILASKTVFRGNCLPLHMIPIGTMIYNVGSQAQKGAVFCRSAGTYAIIMAKEEKLREDGIREVTGRFIQVRLQSGEVRNVSKDACATIGVASNPNYQYRQLGKAGRARWLNIRPTVRGVAMNANDHPHGGGRGKSKGNRPPTSPWGTLAKGGFKTRRKHNVNRWVVTARPRMQGRGKTKDGKKSKE